MDHLRARGRQLHTTFASLVTHPLCGMDEVIQNGPITRYVKVRFAHAPRIPGTFSPSPGVSDPAMHRGTCATHVAWCMPRSLTSGYLWNRWWGKRSRHSRRMRNPQFFVSGKKPMADENSGNPLAGRVDFFPQISSKNTPKITCTALKGQWAMLHQWYPSTLHDVYDSENEPFGFSLHYVNGRIGNK